MGIPLFFKFLCKKFPKCIIDLPFFLEQHHSDELYFDLNGLIHPACHNVKKNNSLNLDNDEIENLIIEETRSEVSKIIDKIKPVKYVNMSVDGVAPFAKMNQQRGRRYKSSIYNKKINTINKKFDVKTIEWDTNMISPGTPFMNKLMKNLDEFTDLLKKKKKINVELSSSNVPGEGEQKILKKIKKDNNQTSTKIIYGLDADLIMLSLISGVSNIYLLRESKIFGEQGTEYLILDINELGNAIYQEVSEIYQNLNDKLTFKKQDIIIDYIVLCFMVGNDFLPNLTMLTIDKGAINYLLKIYTQILYKFNKPLVSNQKINWDIFVEILEYMTKDEDNFVKLFHNNYVKKKYFIPSHLTEYEKELRKLEYTPLISNIHNNIEFNKKGWKDRYYSRYLKLENIRDKDIKKIVSCYIRGLQWTLLYYIDECPSWDWYYPYECSPTVDDFFKYLKREEFPNIMFDESEPLPPIKQLLCILPRKSLELIPKTLKYINDLEFLYPSKFHIDMLYKTYHHQCNVYLPKINYNYIKDYDI